MKKTTVGRERFNEMRTWRRKLARKIATEQAICRRLSPPDRNPYTLYHSGGYPKFRDRWEAALMADAYYCTLLDAESEMYRADPEKYKEWEKKRVLEFD